MKLFAMPTVPVRSESGVPEFPCGPRGIETAIVRKALPWLALIAPLCLLGGWLAAGMEGLISAAIGLVLGAGNIVGSAVVMERAARIGGTALMAGALFGFIGRLIVLTAAVLVLQQFDFIAVKPLVIVIAVTFIGLLVVEALVVSADDRAQTRARVLGGSPPEPPSTTTTEA